MRRIGVMKETKIEMARFNQKWDEIEDRNVRKRRTKNKTHEND